jgi:hypothetical protein
MATYLPNVTDVIPEPALFTPNFSFLDTMLRRRQGLYEQGFAQVNSAYNFVNRNVTNPYSAQTRDRFLKQANENLKNLSSLDLSQQQNVQAAASVFEPFIKNRPVLMDMAFTAHMDQQESIAESYRLKDGGKEFSEDNVAYIRQQRAAFANDDISTVGSYYSNRRSFNPYYDYYKEVKEAMKEFKPSTYKIDHINGLYKITKDDKSWREAEVAEYLNGVLSDKAKQQMRIESQVRLNNSPENLAVSYKQVAQQQLEMNKYNMDLIDKEIVTTKDKALLDKLKVRKQSLEDNNREIDTNIQNISKGDLSYIKNNSERLSSSIYFNSKLSGFVKSFAHDDITTSIDADQVGLSLMREARADARQQRAFAHAEKMKMLEVDGLPGNFQTRELAEGEEGRGIESSINKMQTDIDTYNKQKEQVTAEMQKYVLNKIKERDPNTKYTEKDMTQSFINSWKKTAAPGGKPLMPGDTFEKYQNELARIHAIQNTAIEKLNSIEAGATQGMSQAEKNSIAQANQKINTIGTITLDDGSKLSAKELAIGLRNGTASASTIITGGFGGSPATHMTTFKINGKQVNASVTYNDPLNRTRSTNASLLSAYNSIRGQMNSLGNTYDKYIKNRENYIKNNFSDLRLTTKVISFDAGSNNAKSLEGSIGTFLPEGYDFKHAGVGATPTNQGNAYFYITPKGDGKDNADDIATKLTAAGAKVRVIKTEKGPAIFEVEGLNNRVANQFRQYSPLESAVVSQMQSYTGARDYQSAPFTTPYGDTKFIIKKSGNLYYLHVNGLGETYPTTFNSPIEAIGAARLLSSAEIDPRTGKKISDYGAKMFMNEVSGSNTQMIDVSGMDYNYRYE